MVATKIDRRQRDLARLDVFRAAHEQRHNLEHPIGETGKDLGCRAPVSQTILSGSGPYALLRTTRQRERRINGAAGVPLLVANGEMAAPEDEGQAVENGDHHQKESEPGDE